MHLLQWIKNLLNPQPKPDPSPAGNSWWSAYECEVCGKPITQKPASHCGHCKRTICAKCEYVPGGCGWCGG